MKNEKHDETQLAWCNNTTGVVSQTLKYLGSIRALCDRPGGGAGVGLWLCHVKIYLFLF